MNGSYLTDESANDDGREAILFPLLSKEGNQRLVAKWIKAHDRYTLADPDQPVETVTFDCCVLDGEMLQTHAETLRARKREAKPVLLPCLLLAPEADFSVIKTDRGEIADNVVFETADEVVSMPIKKAELEWRIQALVRLRTESLRLEERTRQLNVLDNVLRHNIRNDLNVIQGRGEQLHDEVEDELVAAADTIVDRADALLATSEKSREITAAISEPREPIPTDLGQIARAIADEAANDWPDVDIAVIGRTKLIVSTIGSIETVLKELFTNAVIHNDSEEPRVRVELAINKSWGTLKMRDNGPGIPEFDRDVLESHSPVETLSHGSGLGLWLVYWTVNHSGGEICVDDREPRGTEITIRLPLVTDK